MTIILFCSEDGIGKLAVGKDGGALAGLSIVLGYSLTAARNPEVVMNGSETRWRFFIVALTLTVPGWFVYRAAAYPMNGDVVSLRQPDGTTTEVRVWGDEFYAVAETLDGYTVVRDPQTRRLCYALRSDDGERLVSTGVRADRLADVRLSVEKHVRIDPGAARAQALAVRADFERRAYQGPLAPPAPITQRATIGAVQGITLIVDFADDPGTIPPASVSDYCNQPGYTGYGNNGSVRDYFHDVSGGLLSYTNYVPAAYYRAIHSKSYYTDPNVSYGQRARELIIEALTAMNDSGFDFSQYDSNGDGWVDALNCFYAGDVWNDWAEGLWPHAWTVYFCADGVCTNRYQITDMGSGLRLGTFCHENGHMLMGWPDLYDYDYDSAGVGVFCLMAFGGFAYNPVQPSAPMKVSAGWADLTLLTTPQTGISAPVAGNVVYKFDHPTLSSEYYLIENRRKSGRDAYLYDQGLAIWHVDTEGNNSNQQQTPALHYLVTLVQADGYWDLENYNNYGDSTDLYAGPQYPACTPSTYPNTNWWDGASSSLSVTNISASASVMTFDFEGLLPPGDLDGDGDVDLADYLELASCLTGPQSACPPACADADLDADGQVDLRDLAEWELDFSNSS